MKENLVMALRVLQIFVVAIILSACDAKREETPSKAPDDVVFKLENTAEKFFGGNEIAGKEWVKRQLDAYSRAESIVPDIPLENYAQIKKASEDEYPDDYVSRLKFLEAQIQAYKRIVEMETYMGPEYYNFVLSMSQEGRSGDYVAQFAQMKSWNDIFNRSAGLRSQMPADTFLEMFKNVCSRVGNDTNRVYSALAAQSECRRKLRSYKNPKLPSDKLDSIKRELSERYPSDFVKQYEELVSRSSDISDKPKVEYSNPDNPMRRKAELIFRDSVFTKRSVEDTIYCAVLVRLKGKVAILCTKDFLSDLPMTFTNSRGRIVCSKIFASKEFPLILAIPDSVPEGFSPIDVVSPQESFDLVGKNLYMIAPKHGGFMGEGVSVYSEDERYLNLAAPKDPTVKRKIYMKSLDRYAEKMSMDISDIVSTGENSVVIDPDSGKLVSMAMRIYEPGQITWGGKTGSIIGHEKMSIPDFASFVREFDGMTRKTEYSPRSSIRFIRLTAFENWESMTPEELRSQKNELRRFTDDNNDFLVFFRRNSFGDAIRSRRLSSIVERYRKPLLSDRLDRASFERYCRNYMIEIQFALRRKLDEYENIGRFYSIYRNEMEYQRALRKAMYDYVTEIIRDDDIMASMPLDLRTRYNDIDNAPVQMGPSSKSQYIIKPK